MPEPAHDTPHPELSGYVLGLVTPDEAERFESHLASCPACRAEVGELAGLPALLDQAAPPTAVPPGLAVRTRAAVEDAAAEASRRHVFTVGAVAAAGVLVVLLTAVLLLRGSDDRPRTSFALASVAGSGAWGRAVAILDEGAGGWVVELDVGGLAAVPEGSYYECWYVAPGDTPERPDRISAGTFVVGADGRASLRMTLGGRLRDYPTMTVSLEPDDGDPRWTGPEVLTGTAAVS
jgi:anti-sigma-K factor RskA